MDVETFLTRIKNQEFFAGQIAHIEEIPSRPAQFGEVINGINPSVQELLEKQGITSLYCLQAEAINHIRTIANPAQRWRVFGSRPGELGEVRVTQ